MIDLDRAVFYFGVAAVVAVATFNHVHAHAAQPQAAPVALSGAALSDAALSGALDNAAVDIPARARPLPAGYWTNPATSPLQGVGLGLIRAADPILHPGTAVRPESRDARADAFGL